MNGPKHPCRLAELRTCPIAYDGPCPPDKPCARFESNDEAPWAADLIEWRRALGEVRRGI